MKLVACIALAAVASANLLFRDIANVISDVTPQIIDVVNDVAPTFEKNGLGALVETRIYDDGFHKIISQPIQDIAFDWSQQFDMINDLTEKMIAMKANDSQQPIYTCSNREPNGTSTSAGAFIPVFVAEVSAATPTMTYKDSKCFEQIDFTFEKVDTETYNVHVKTGKKHGILCKEAFVFANTEIFHIEIFAFKGDHTLTFKAPNANSQADMDFGGIKVYESCDGAIDLVKSIVNMAKCFLGGISDHPKIPVIGSHVPPYMEEANVKFLHEAKGQDLVPRDTKKVEIDPALIQDGDALMIMRLDGLDQIIMYGTGAYIGHNTMAMRFDGELYIVESQDAWYWPTPNLQRTKWADWIKQAEDASFSVAHLPMREEIRKNFDNAKAVAFFNETAGLPYGYHNFLYGWIDTPRDNIPPLLPNEFLPILFSIVEMIAPDTAKIFFTEALNFRLGTKDLDIAGCAAAAAGKGMSVQELMAEVEQDGWEYTGITPRDGRSWVCSAYVAAVYKAAGLFGDMEINATEFGPTDVYELNFFDGDYKRPQACIDADPTLPYCQLLGNYRIDLPGYNTVTPYPHMNEKCGRVWPHYTRPDKC